MRCLGQAPQQTVGHLEDFATDEIQPAMLRELLELVRDVGPRFERDDHLGLA